MAHVLAVCGVCNNGVLIRSRDKGSSQHGSLLQHQLDFPGSRFEVLQAWPEYHSRAPENAPSNVASFYEQGLENIKNKRWDAAGAMFRKSLDVATKILSPEHRSATLFSRINKMVEAGTLTSAMGDWSHEVRLDGNDAVHDDEPETEADARAAHKFAEAVLTYAFTLPALVNANRAKRQPANDASNAAA